MNSKPLIFFEGDEIPCEQFNATNHVGFGIICGKTIIVLPKLFKNNIDKRNDYLLDFLAMLDIYLGFKPKEQDYSPLRESDQKANIVFHQIMIHLFSVELERQLAYGLDREYTKYVLESPNMKGRLLLTKQLRKPPYKQHILSLRRHVRTEDTILNRIFKKTIKEALRNAEWKGSIERLSSLQGYFNNVSNVEQGRIKGLINKVSLNRLNERFSTALTLAKIILLGLYEKPSVDTNIGFFIKSEELFEKIVYTVLIKRFQREYEVVYQKGSSDFADIITDTEEHIKSISIVPDFQIKKNDKTVLILDAKYKELRAENTDITEKESNTDAIYQPNIQDIYQLYSYMQTCEADAGLIYPLYWSYNEYAEKQWKNRLISFKAKGGQSRKLKIYFLDIRELRKKKPSIKPDIDIE